LFKKHDIDSGIMVDDTAVIFLSNEDNSPPWLQRKFDSLQS